MDGIDARYQRQVLLPEIGTDGQSTLGESSVLVIGAGGLGGPALQYLAAAGIGRISIMDGDIVSESNLNRQILYGTHDIGHSKALMAVEKLRQINDLIEITAVPEMLTEENAHKVICGHDALVLCLDSFEARKIANRACVAAEIPFVEAGVQGFYGTMTTVLPGETPCYECIHALSSPPEGPVPILGAMAGWMGCAEALAVIKLLLGKPDPSRGAILFFDGMEMTVERVAIERNLNCTVCVGR